MLIVSCSFFLAWSRSRARWHTGVKVERLISSTTRATAHFHLPWGAHLRKWKLLLSFFRPTMVLVVVMLKLHYCTLSLSLYGHPTASVCQYWPSSCVPNGCKYALSISLVSQHFQLFKKVHTHTLSWRLIIMPIADRLVHTDNCSLVKTLSCIFSQQSLSHWCWWCQILINLQATAWDRDWDGR